MPKSKDRNSQRKKRLEQVQTFKSITNDNSRILFPSLSRKKDRVTDDMADHPVHNYEVIEKSFSNEIFEKKMTSVKKVAEIDGRELQLKMLFLSGLEDLLVPLRKSRMSNRRRYQSQGG